MRFNRDVYLEQLIKKRDNSLIKVITGARRSGKSHLMNTIFYEYLLKTGIKEKNIIQFAFDNDETSVREKRSLYYIDDSFKKIIVTKDGLDVRRDENGFSIIDLFQFLLNINSLEMQKNKSR